MFCLAIRKLGISIAVIKKLPHFWLISRSSRLVHGLDDAYDTGVDYRVVYFS